MTGDTRVTLNRSAAALIAITLVVAGAAGSYLLTANRDPSVMPSADRPAALTGSEPAKVSAAATKAAAPLPDVVVAISEDAIERAGIVVAAVTSAPPIGGLRLPGSVEPNAYKHVAVTALVAGRVTRVAVSLGDRVRRGQSLAQLYSPELAEAQSKYASATAVLQAHDRELERTHKLVEIGAASRQELERIHAEHAAQSAAVQSARSALELLGVPAGTINALASGGSVSANTNVPAPMDGVVTQRVANVGLNVDPSTPLFTIVDLSTVWIVADVYEKDFSRVTVGSGVVITTTAYPDLSLRGRVSYIDPQVNVDSRTAKIRVEVPNPDGKLRLGMFVDLTLTGAAGASVPVVPRGAIQNVGDRTVVYLVDSKQPGKFTEREVRLGEAADDHIEVLSGLQPGDVIVSEGSFFVRAERDRLGLRAATSTSVTDNQREADRPDQTIKVVVDEKGFEPAKISVRGGGTVRLAFVRTSDKTCATEVAFPSLDIKRALPLNELVTVQFTPEKSGEIPFACGMNMFKGLLVVQ